jgi:hypothetical protein
MTVDVEPPAGMSVYDRELFEHLIGHLQSENELIEEYDRLATEAGGHVRYLLRLIVEDERRHHRLFEEWCNSLRSMAEFRPVEPEVPLLTRTPHPDEVVASVRRFLATERADKKDLARLKKLVKDQRDVTLWDALLEVMELDTQKHITLLRFIERHPGKRGD